LVSLWLLLQAPTHKCGWVLDVTTCRPFHSGKYGGLAMSAHQSLRVLHLATAALAPADLKKLL
jgi:hypothetical protein